MAQWGYCKANGPDNWCNVAPAARGLRQSPIDIKPSEATFDSSLKTRPFKITYKPENCEKIFNNGHSVQVAINPEGSSLEGGPLMHRYRAAQFHFHWGKSSDRGSEHRINGKMYAAEGHIVHYNADLFPDIGDAVKSEFGLCVLGFFLKIGKAHPGIQKLTDKMQQITSSGDTLSMPEGFDPASLLPNNRSEYWTYPGSLTTPPCYESVTWVVFKEPIEVSEEQMNVFRSLRTHKMGEQAPNDELAGCMVENYRPPLSIGDRLLRASFM